MAKASSPVRLQGSLMESAALAGARQHRSAAQQIEYWAALGQQVAALVDPDKLLAVQAGVARLTVESIDIAPPSPEQVLVALENDRRSGVLAQGITSAAWRYQAIPGQPGLLERIGSDGTRRIGRFAEGDFVPAEPTNL